MAPSESGIFITISMYKPLSNSIALLVTGRICALPGFGEKIELNILQAIEAHTSQAGRFKLAMAAQYAEALGLLAAAPGVKQVTVAGSYRRMRETVGRSRYRGRGNTG